MDSSGLKAVSIGKFEVPIDRAISWVSAYTDGDINRESAAPFAYPAYDRYNSNANDPAVLHDADLMAPGLLNVPIKIRSFYGLQSVRAELEAGLARAELAKPLADLDDDLIAELVGNLYAVLDNPDKKPWGVRETTLSKVLHRKRPASLALHDKWVQACYLGDDAVPRVKGRSWAAYMAAVSQAMAKDLRDQERQFALLQTASNARPALTDLRLLDILAWNVGQDRGGSYAVSTNLE
jgi:hypothetical protein